MQHEYSGERALTFVTLRHVKLGILRAMSADLINLSPCNSLLLLTSMSLGLKVQHIHVNGLQMAFLLRTNTLSGIKKKKLRG